MPSYASSISRLDADALMPEDLFQEVFDGIEQQSIVMDKMTRGEDMERLVSRMRVLDTLPDAAFTDGDTDLAQTTEMAWRNKYMVAGEIRVTLPIPRNILDDAGPGYDLIGSSSKKIRQAIAKKIDAAILLGTNAPRDWPASMKAQAIAAGQSVSLASFTDPYQALAGVGGAYSLGELHGYDANGGIGSIAFKAQLRGMTDGINRPLLLGQDTGVTDASRMSVGGVPYSFANNAAFSSSDMLAIVGDFKSSIYCFRKDVTVELLTEGVISNPAGLVTINLAQSRVVALMVWVRLGWQVPNPPNLLAPGNTVDATDSNTGRSPFSVLTA
jgi:HK97 family phage major capsid protein